MNYALILSLLTGIAQVTNQASVIAKIIDFLIEAIPLIEQEVSDLIPMVKGVIEALSANAATTADQMTQLKQTDAAADAKLDAAIAAAEAQDGAAGQ